MQTWFLRCSESPMTRWKAREDLAIKNQHRGQKEVYPWDMCLYIHPYIQLYLGYRECSLPHQQLPTRSFHSRKKIRDRLEVMSNYPLSSIPAATQAHTLVPCWPSKFEHLKCSLVSHVCPVTNWLLAVAVCAPFSRVWQGLLLVVTVIIFTRRKKISCW